MEDGQHIARLLPGHVWAAAKRLSKKLRLRAIALDKRLWASHSKFCWQFLILSLCASLRRRLRAEGPGGAEDYGAGCSDRRICLLFDVTQLCCWAPRERWPGGTLHTMPLHVCLPCQQCDPVSCPGGAVGGRGGNVLHFTETATRDTPRKASFT